jgi:hypothetical protein
MMSDDPRVGGRAASTLSEAAKVNVPQPDVSIDEPFAAVEPAEDTVPYLPPLESYRLEAIWGEVRRGVPLIFPDELIEDADDDV